MLDRLLKIIVFSLAISINSVFPQTDEIKILSIRDALETLRVNESVMVEESNVYLASFYYAESGVANRMALLLKTESMNAVSRIDESIAFLEKMKGIRFAEK